MRDAGRHFKEATAGNSSSSDELLAQWRAATTVIRAVCIPASHLAQMNSWCIVRAHRNSHRKLSVLTLLRAETFQSTSPLRYTVVFEQLNTFCPVSSVGVVRERHVQLERTSVSDETLVTEYQVYLDEQKFRLRWANP